MNINEIKEEEVQAIYDFYDHVQNFGHIYHYPVEMLDEPFRKILEGIKEVTKLMDDSYSM